MNLNDDPTLEQEGARMNLDDNPNLEQFRELLRQHDDRAGHHVLWVRRDGEVMLTCLPKGEGDPRELPTYEHPSMQIRYDTFQAGGGYVGEAGATEDWWMPLLLEKMREHWAALKGAPGMTHVDLDTIAPDGLPVSAEEAAEIKRGREEFARRKQSGQKRHRCRFEQ
jgi:hypothetical protein